MKNRADAIGKPQAEKLSGLPLQGEERGSRSLYHSYKHGADEEMVDGHEGVAFVVPVCSP